MQLAPYEALISSGGSKLTKQRKQILNVMLAHSDEHFSADSLFALLSNIDPSIGIATVYRTLELFEKLNIVRNVKIKNDGTNYYDLVDLTDEHHIHHHLVCQVCQKITEIDDELEQYEKYILEKYGFLVNDHDLTFYGVCSSCSNS